MAREFLNEGAALEVHTSEDLAARLAEVIDNPTLSERMAAAALRILERNRGATERALDAILASSGPQPPTGTSPRPAIG
jgi:3-deoxy-D-manno-octulosonic-acid transferase